MLSYVYTAVCIGYLATPLSKTFFYSISHVFYFFMVLLKNNYSNICNTYTFESCYLNEYELNNDFIA